MKSTFLSTIFILMVSCPGVFAGDFENRTFDCNFTTHVVSTLEEGKFQTKYGNKSFPMTFSGFNEKSAKALLIGNAGSDEVFFFPGDKKALLVQITGANNGSMTSISAPRNGVSVAFHTRHMWILGEPVVSHYYDGLCTVRK